MKNHFIYGPGRSTAGLWATAALACALALCWRATGPGNIAPTSALLAAAFALCFSQALAAKIPAARGIKLWFPALALAAAFPLALFPVRAWVLGTWGDPSYSLHLFYLDRSWPGYEGIPASPFRDWSLLLWPLLWWSATLALAWRAWQKPSPAGLWMVAACAFAGKFAIAALSSTGLEVLPQQVQGLSTAYYRLAQLADHYGIANFIRDFNQLQSKLGTHGETHPFGPELFYWLLARLHPGPWLPSLAIIAATSLTPWLLGSLALELGLGPRGALAAALLYAASPASTILAASGIDSVTSLLATGCCWLLAKRRDWQAGLALFSLSLLTTLAAALMLLAALLAVAARPKDLKARAAAFLAPLAAGHLLLLLATGGHFHYWEVAQQGLRLMAQGPGARPYFLWSWLDPLLYAGYLGLGSLGLCLALAPALLARRISLSAGLAVGLGVLGGVWMQGIGHAEVQRIHHWGYGLLSLAAALALSKDRDWAKRGFSLLALFATLNMLASALLEVLVIDYW